MNDAGKVCGAGVLLNPHQVLTCAHVVSEALGGRSDDGPPRGPVSIDFPAHPEVGVQVATVAAGGWCPPRDDGRGDIAVLALRDGMTSVLETALRRSADLWGREVRVFGYPGRIDDGVWAEARLLGRGGPGDEWVQVEGMRSTGRRVEQGFSGAGVIDVQTGTVLGLIVAEDRLIEAKVAWMLPVDVILNYWSGLLQSVSDLLPEGAIARQVSVPDAGHEVLEVGLAIELAGQLAQDSDKDEVNATELTGSMRIKPLLRLTRSTARDGSRRETLDIPDRQLAREFLPIYLQDDGPGAEAPDER